MLKGLKIKNFRSIGNKYLELRSLAPINYLVGKNGSGKSSVLQCLSVLQDFQADNINRTFDGQKVIYHLENQSDTNFQKYLKFESVSPTEISFFNLNSNFHSIDAGDIPTLDLLNSPLNLTFAAQSGQKKKNLVEVRGKCLGSQMDMLTILQSLWDLHIYPNRRDSENLNLQDIVQFGYQVANFSGKSSEKTRSFLYEPHNYQLLFDTINKFMGDLMVIHGQDLTFKKHSLQKADLSSGQLWICTLVETVLQYYKPDKDLSLDFLLIDEPETSLHPDWQKKIPMILEALQKSLGCQIFVATHSPFIISSALESTVQKIYHIDNGLCSQPKGLSKKDLSRTAFGDIVTDLGCRPSDLLYANGIIWVEGPSDITYIQAWLDLYCKEWDKPNFRKGFDYEYAVYGGALLNVLYCEDGDIEIEQAKLINMLALNRNFFVVMDNDIDPESGRARSNFEKSKEYIKFKIESINRKHCGYWYELNNNIHTIESYLTEKSAYFKDENGNMQNYFEKSGYKKYSKAKGRFSKNLVAEWLHNKIKLSDFKPELLSHISFLHEMLTLWNKK